LTHKFPIKDYKKAFEVMQTGQCGKIVLEW
jgi:threonine 3-dehydrogenase